MFWKAYPRKVAKGAAEKAFARVAVEAAVLIAAIERQKQSDQWTRDGGQFIPHPATWLHQRRWEDEPTVAVAPSPPPPPDYLKTEWPEWLKANGYPFVEYRYATFQKDDFHRARKKKLTCPAE